MLIAKHLQPWLLVYLVVCSVQIVMIVGLIVIVNVNKINGVIDYPVYNLLTVCPTYSYMKIQANGESVMRICFVMSIISGVLAVGQVLFIIYEFVMFRRFMQQNNGDEQAQFKQLTTKKLVALYIMNALGLLCLIPVVGSLLAFYIELKYYCQQSQSTLAQTYLIPMIIAGVALLCQLILFVFTLKFLYHNGEEQHNEEANKQGAQTKQQHELADMQAAKRRIFESGKMTNQQQKSSSRDNYKTHYNSQNSIQQQTPRDIQSELLDKKMHQNNPYNNMSKRQGKTIYDDDNNNNVLSYNNKKDKLLGNTTTSNMRQQLSPNSISRKQKQLMKKLPKHPFKKGNTSFGPNEVIFEQSYSQENGSLDQQNTLHVDDDQNTTKSINQTAKKNKPTEKVSQYGNNNRYQGNQQQQKQQKQQTKPQSLRMSEIFNQRYQNSPYLKNLQNKNITPAQRRKIKKPYLKLDSQLIQIDAKNDFLTFTFHPSYTNTNDENLYEMKSKNNKQQLQIQNMSKNNKKQPQTPTQLKSLSKSRSTTYYMQKSFIEGQRHQDQNPIQNYVKDDEDHEDHINKILNFEKMSKKRRKTFAATPFFPFSDKEDPGKLYLHKNDYNAGNYNKSNVLQDDQEEEGYDPFRDQAYDDEHLTYRGLMGEDELRSSGSKSTSKNDSIKRPTTKQIQPPSTAKKSSTRKDTQLLEFIRSKHVVD